MFVHTATFDQRRFDDVCCVVFLASYDKRPSLRRSAQRAHAVCIGGFKIHPCRMCVVACMVWCTTAEKSTNDAEFNATRASSDESRQSSRYAASISPFRPVPLRLCLALFCSGPDAAPRSSLSSSVVSETPRRRCAPGEIRFAINA